MAACSRPARWGRSSAPPAATRSAARRILILLVPGQYGDDEHAYLIDFGITKNVETDRTLTMTGHLVGTPEYVAPEQIENDRIDGRADQYALACVLHHCLTGSPPFQRDTTVDVLFAHMHADPPRPSTVCTGLPESVDNAIMRALSKDPARRFETCRAFIAAARAGTGAPTPVRPTAAPLESTTIPVSPPTPPPPPPPPPPTSPRLGPEPAPSPQVPQPARRRPRMHRRHRPARVQARAGSVLSR